ncbi:uncharacterized protein LOC111456538 isoform X7 [Cucurbita moschata]|uniref:Uncharacterized protein LOC111456538 isoform X7 n=1 Tax=Cucurbita moschata TaxID=3662 RepID=A0A6J1GRV0_CUCMO|nr:uncharacterized protein LOC111456538 isoform X7 [Cucurbita moschata]
MDENLKIQRFEVPPSASNFEFLIESRDVPAEALWTGDLYRSGFRTMAALAIYRNHIKVDAPLCIITMAFYSHQLGRI